MNHSEFLNIVMPFKDKLYRLAKRLLISDAEAEDATQEVLLKLWTNKQGLKKYRSVEAFSMTMLKNYCFDKLKSKHSKNVKLVHNNYDSGNASLQHKVEIKDSVSWVEKIINTLPEQQRIIIQLRDIEHYELKEIEKITNMSAINIRVTLSRARKTIREQLQKTHNYGVKTYR